MMLRKTLSSLAIRTLGSRPISALMAPVRRQCVPIFMLHRLANSQTGVRGHDRHVLVQALDYIASHNYQPLSLRNLMTALIDGRSLPENAVVFTIDDGFQDQAEDIVPLFTERQIPVTLFVATDLIENQGWSWDFKLDHVIQHADEQRLDIRSFGFDCAPIPLNSDENRRTALRKVRQALKEMHPSGALQGVQDVARTLNSPVPTEPPAAYRATDWATLRGLESELVDIAPHGINHVILSRLSDQEAEQEIKQGWAKVRDQLADPLPVFCYPTGREGIDFGDREQALVKSTGLLGAVSTDPGYVRPELAHSHRYRLPRFSMPTHDINEFIKCCSWIERGRQLVTGKI